MQLAKQALSIAAQAFLFPLNAFYELLGRSGTLSIYWGFFLLATVFRLLVAPLIGSSISAGSDTVKRHRVLKKSAQDKED